MRANDKALQAMEEASLRLLQEVVGGFHSVLPCGSLPACLPQMIENQQVIRIISGSQ